MEITDIYLVENVGKVVQGKLVLLPRVTQAKKSLCDYHRKVAVLGESYFVYSHCLKSFLFNTSLCYVVEQLFEIVPDLLLDLHYFIGRAIGNILDEQKFLVRDYDY